MMIRVGRSTQHKYLVVVGVYYLDASTVRQVEYRQYERWRVRENSARRSAMRQALDVVRRRTNGQDLYAKVISCLKGEYR